MRRRGPVGCSTPSAGALSWSSALTSRSTCCDLASEASSQAVPLVMSEAERLPFRDDAFDVVVSIRFFQHLPTSQIIPIIEEMERVSRLGVLIQAPIRKLTSAPIKTAADAKRFLLHRGAGPRPPFRSQRPANRYFPVAKSEFERALGEAGSRTLQFDVRHVARSATHPDACRSSLTSRRSVGR